MRIKELMTNEVKMLPPTATLREAAKQMETLNVGAMPVGIVEKPIGIITDRDIAIRAVANGMDPDKTPVSEVMTANVVTTTEDMDIEDAARLMEEKKLRRIVVLNDEGHLCGILSLGDFAVKTDNSCRSGEVLEKVSKPVGSPIN